MRHSALIAAALALLGCGEISHERPRNADAWNLRSDTLIHSTPFTELSVATDGGFSLDGRVHAEDDLSRVLTLIQQIEPAPVLVVTYEGEEEPQAWARTIAAAESRFCDLPETWCWKGPASEAPPEIQRARRARARSN